MPRAPSSCATPSARSLRSAGSSAAGAWAPAGFQGFDHGVVVRDWLVCGPFGGGPAKTFYRDPSLAGRDPDPVTRFFDAANYPPERGKVDPNAVFTGDMIRGYWPDPGEEQWTPRSIADGCTGFNSGPSRLKMVRWPRSAQSFRAWEICLKAG